MWRCVRRMEGEQGSDPAARCCVVLGPATHPANSTARLVRGHAAGEQHNSNHNGRGRQDVNDAHSIQDEGCIALRQGGGKSADWLEPTLRQGWQQKQGASMRQHWREQCGSHQHRQPSMDKRKCQQAFKQQALLAASCTHQRQWTQWQSRCAGSAGGWSWASR